jgi:hypothetical protein
MSIPGHEPRRRRVPIDWDELEIALTWHSDESECYLDLRTGEVHRVSSFPADRADDELSEEAVEEAFAAGHLVRVEPFPSSVEYGWMAEFTGTVKDARLRDLLEVALNGRGTFRRFKDVLAEYPADRERWFRFHDERVREAMREWLEDNDIEPTTVPPERPQV